MSKSRWALHSDDRAADTILESALSSALPRLVAAINKSETIHLAILNSKGAIIHVNRAFADTLSVDPLHLKNLDIKNILTAADAKLFANYLAGKEPLPDEEMLINFTGGNQIPFTLCCFLARTEDRLLLFAEPPAESNRRLQEELLHLNNRLAVLSRENARKGRELTKALGELKKAESMMVHKEKMASLGLMTAGIAHEINNPLAFVLNNEQLLKRDFDDMARFLKTIGDLLPRIGELSSDIHDDIVAKASETDLAYLSTSIPRKIGANIEGLERVKKIVFDLRNFSRLDEAEQKLCCLAEGINSTLLFLSPLAKEHGVLIETELTPMPPILCMPGPLNQAISNLLVNAIQASNPGQLVRITTREAGDFQCIEVYDQGSGILPENRGKIFEPFFTTKPVGSGTGLGLSIVHQVVEAHNGKIELESIPGAGTKFRILLPVAL